MPLAGDTSARTHCPIIPGENAVASIPCPLTTRQCRDPPRPGTPVVPRDRTTQVRRSVAAANQQRAKNGSSAPAHSVQRDDASDNSRRPIDTPCRIGTPSRSHVSSRARESLLRPYRHIGAMPHAGIRAHSGTVQRLVVPVDLARFDSTVKVPMEGSGRTRGTQAAAFLCARYAAVRGEHSAGSARLGLGRAVGIIGGSGSAHRAGVGGCDGALLPGMFGYPSRACEAAAASVRASGQSIPELPGPGLERPAPGRS